MVAFPLGDAACAETPEPAQDDSIEAIRTPAIAGDAEAQDNFGTMYHRGETMFSLLDNGRSVAVRTFAYVLVAVVCLALTSCGGGNPNRAHTGRYCRYCRHI